MQQGCDTAESIKFGRLGRNRPVPPEKFRETRKATLAD
jgi:hypothetical protein